MKVYEHLARMIRNREMCLKSQQSGKATQFLDEILKVGHDDAPPEITLVIGRTDMVNGNRLVFRYMDLASLYSIDRIVSVYPDMAHGIDPKISGYADKIADEVGEKVSLWLKSEVKK